MRKEVIGLQIMKSNYDQIVKANQSQSGQSENRVPDEVKFQLVCFVIFKDSEANHNLFSSFRLSWRTFSLHLILWCLLLVLWIFQVMSLPGLKNIVNLRYDVGLLS